MSRDDLRGERWIRSGRATIHNRYGICEADAHRAGGRIQRSKLPVSPDDAAVSVCRQEARHSIDAVMVRTEIVTLNVRDRSGCICTGEGRGDGKIAELLWAVRKSDCAHQKDDQRCDCKNSLHDFSSPLIVDFKPFRCSDTPNETAAK